VAAVAVVPGTPWTVWVGFPEAAVLEPARRFLRQMSLGALVFLGMAALFTALATRRITQPLVDLTQAAARLTKGEYDGPIPVRRLDEIAMSAQIAEAQTQLRQQLGELRTTSDRLRAVVGSVPMTLWSVDREGIVTLWEGTLLQRVGINAEAPRRRVLFISGYAPGALKQASQIPSDAAFLQKPFSVQTLLQKVQDVLGMRPSEPS
jgi:methyl-accepting chemotaxis protein